MSAKQDRYEEYTAADQDNQYLKMKVRDRQRWSTIDDYAYWNDSRYDTIIFYDYYRNNITVSTRGIILTPGITGTVLFIIALCLL